MKRALKIAAGVVGGLTALILLAAVVLPWVIDPSDYRDDIEAMVEQRTGRELAIDGPIELSVFPWLGAEVTEVTLGNAPGFGPDPFARVAAADVRVRLLPLILGRMEVGKVVLHEAAVNLARDAAGRTNWADLTGRSEGPEPADDGAGDAPPPDEQGKAGTLTVAGLELRRSRITWTDGVTGARYTATDLDLASGAVAPGEPFALDLQTRVSSTAPELAGEVRLEGEVTAEPGASRYRLRVTELAADLTGDGLPTGALQANLAGDLRADMAAGQASVEGLDLRAYGTRLKGRLTGTGIGDVPALDGRFTATVADGQTLAEAATAFAPDLQWQPQALAASRLEGRIAGDLGPEGLTLEGLSASLLGLEVTGQAQLRRPGDGAVVTGDLSGRVTDGRRLVAPLADRLPATLAPQALDGAEVDAAARLDTAAGRARVDRLRLAALGSVATANATVIGLDASPEATGRLSTEPFSPRRVLTDLGLEVPATADPEALNKAAVDTAFRISPGAASLSDLTLTLDDSRLTGSAAMPRFEGPEVRFDLALDRLDANRYLPPAADNGGSDSGSGADTPGQAAEAGADQLPIELLQRLAVVGDLTAGRLRVRDLRLSDLRAHVEGSDGRFRIHPLTARLYQGRYAGDVRIDARGDTPQVTLDERLTGIDVGALLTDLTGKATVTGTADLAADLAFQGLSTRAILATLAGDGGYTLRRGAIAGVDLEQALTKAYAALGKAASEGQADGTAFRALRGSATVDGGKIRSDDLSLRSQALDAEGGGFVDLAEGRVDYRLETVVGKDASAAIKELKGLTVPMRIRGPLTAPGVKVELEQALRQRAKASAEKEKEKAEGTLEEELDKKKDELEEKARDLLNF